MKKTLAVTGATGFVGHHLITRATAAGLTVRALTRRPQPAMPNVEWVDGALDSPASLKKLVNGTEAVIHLAGIINARNDAAFDAGNVAGTAAMITAACESGPTRFIHVSSLAAREPELSAYGRSKAKSEAVVATSDRDWTIVRPPAVYGPGDKETLELFRMANRGVMFLPPPGRLSVIHAHDLSDLLIALAAPGTAAHLTIEPDDGTPSGWDHHSFARAIGRAVERRVMPLSLPSALIRFGATIDTSLARLSGRLPKLSHDRARYFCHPDWVVSEEKRPNSNLWQPAISTEQGLKETARWYRDAGWL